MVILRYTRGVSTLIILFLNELLLFRLIPSSLIYICFYRFAFIIDSSNFLYYLSVLFLLNLIHRFTIFRPNICLFGWQFVISILLCRCAYVISHVALIVDSVFSQVLLTLFIIQYPYYTLQFEYPITTNRHSFYFVFFFYVFLMGLDAIGIPLKMLSLNLLTNISSFFSIYLIYTLSIISLTLVLLKFMLVMMSWNAGFKWV